MTIYGKVMFIGHTCWGNVLLVVDTCYVPECLLCCVRPLHTNTPDDAQETFVNRLPLRQLSWCCLTLTKSRSDKHSLLRRTTAHTAHKVSFVIIEVGIIWISMTIWLFLIILTAYCVVFCFIITSLHQCDVYTLWRISVTYTHCDASVWRKQDIRNSHMTR
jgi:hypothetical protein